MGLISRVSSRTYRKKKTNKNGRHRTNRNPRPLRRRIPTKNPLQKPLSSYRSRNRRTRKTENLRKTRKRSTKCLITERTRRGCHFFGKNSVSCKTRKEYPQKTKSLDR